MVKKFGRHFIHKETDAIVCRNCGKTGKILWDQVSRAGGSAPELKGIDGPFFERLSKKAPYPIELICRDCGGVAITAYPSTSLFSKDRYN